MDEDKRKLKIKDSEYNKGRAITFERVKKYIEDNNNGNGCSLITTEDEFNKQLLNVNGSRVKLLVKCKCGEKYPVMYYAFKDGQKQCPKCGDKKLRDSKRNTLEQVKQFIENTFSEKIGIKYYLISEEYKNARTILHLMDRDGYKYTTKYNNLLNINSDINKKRLYPFHKSNEYSIYNIKLWLSQNAPEYELLSNEYIDIFSKLRWKCPEGHIFKMSFDNFKHGNRCSFCNMSNGEQLVLDWIMKNKLVYEYQYEFVDCIAKKRRMPFDFAIFNDNNNLKFLIEYDGELHYQISRLTKDKEYAYLKLKEQQRRDKLKDKYCNEHNINLIRIPYWEKKNIQSILDKQLNTQLSDRAS